MGRSRTGPLLVVPLLVGSCAALLYSNFILDWVLRGFSGMGEVVSELEAPGQQNATLLRVTDVVCAVLVVCLLPGVRRRLPRGAWREVVVVGTTVFALGAALAAVVTTCGPGDAACGGDGQQLADMVHEGSSIVSDTALYVGAAAVWLSLRHREPRWFRRAAAWFVLLGGVGSTLVFAYFHQTQDPVWAVGVSQRVHILAISAWILCLGIFAASPVDEPPDPSPTGAGADVPQRLSGP